MTDKTTTIRLAALFIASIVALTFALATLLFTPETAHAKQLVIGDSRTTGMYDAVNYTSNSFDIEVTSGDVFWRAKNGAGFEWLKSEGVPFVDQWAALGDDVIILVGVNDCPSNPQLGCAYSASDYAALINAKALSWRIRGVNVFYVLPLPVDDTKAAMSGYWHRDASVASFNAAMAAGLSRDVKHINYYDVLKHGGALNTPDGVHYGHDTYRKMKKDIDRFIQVVHKVRRFCSCEPASDVFSSVPHSSDVEWLMRAGISTGWDNGNGTKSFRPYADVTRADMAAFLFRLGVRWGVVDSEWTANLKQKVAFRDVYYSTPHRNEIWWIASAGISEGWRNRDGTRSFRPYDTVTRQDMAAFIYRLAHKAGKGRAAITVSRTVFSDVSARYPDCHHKEILWLASNGISEGWKTGASREFRGALKVTRCDMAAFLKRADSL